MRLPRMLLIRTAERTLDVQYYIWRRDTTGILLLEALHAAADRGVHVRLLLDDNGTAGLDRELRALDGHPHIEVRLFNPFKCRAHKWTGFLTDFSRANRRMHNKSITADARATIVGGRNIGDEYFGATEDVLFVDVDVLAVGPVVNEVAADFERYWTYASSWPVEQVLPAVSDSELAGLALRAANTERHARAAVYVEAVRTTSAIRALLRGDLPCEWAHARLVSDDPGKGLKNPRKGGLLIHQLADVLDTPAAEVDLMSPYFVPTASGVAAFRKLVASGVKVRVLTNALEATDVAAVHAGYAKRRKALLEAGVELYEMRRQAAADGPRERAGPFGSSGSSLHAKTFAVDRARVFIGSFNFDPRSAALNTELGFVIDSPALAQQVSATFDQHLARAAYRLQLNANGKLCWLEQSASATIRHDAEPGTGFWRRAMTALLAMLPIEWML